MLGDSESNITNFEGTHTRTASVSGVLFIDEVMQDEENDDADYTGAVSSGNDLSATDLRGTIKGRIANDSNDSTGLTGDESRSGVVVALHKASAAIGSGANRGRRSAGAAVTDANGDPVTAETDDEGDVWAQTANGLPKTSWKASTR